MLDVTRGNEVIFVTEQDVSVNFLRKQEVGVNYDSNK